ncbi:uncharacterized protein LOC123636575 isoform X2 [Lemur catta]|uniref:uncharacterized protein LOC123636575 isoform X2 n=1 Tax=Lemur catta TaxID=9447 RepID=UPI001E269D3C|nr:uncharacterized protein LOC123636575 isoform X2 [Lemur catta]
MEHTLFHHPLVPGSHFLLSAPGHGVYAREEGMVLTHQWGRGRRRNFICPEVPWWARHGTTGLGRPRPRVPSGSTKVDRRASPGRPSLWYPFQMLARLRGAGSWHGAGRLLLQVGFLTRILRPLPALPDALNSTGFPSLVYLP